MQTRLRLHFGIHFIQPNSPTQFFKQEAEPPRQHVPGQSPGTRKARARTGQFSKRVSLVPPYRLKYRENDNSRLPHVLRGQLRGRLPA